MGVVLARVVEVADGATVSNDDAGETPFITEDVLKQAVAAAARLTLVTLVGAHHFLHVGFLNY